MQGIIGLALLIGVAFLLSENRREIRWRPVAVGLALQIGLALLLTRAGWFKGLFLGLNQLALAFDRATQAGTALVFGYLGGSPLPFAESYPGASFILAFRALPLVLVISAVSALLFHWGVVQRVVRLFATLLEKTMGVGGAVGVGAAANIFVGMIEAPLLIRPYLQRMSRGELFMVMTCGMATIAGTVLVLYATILQPVLPDALGQILTASIISAPAALLIALIMVPHAGDATDALLLVRSESHSSMDAIVTGTAEGVKLLLQIAAMLIVLVALVSLANQALGLLPELAGAPLTLERLLGWLLAPLAWTIGIPWSEAAQAGSLLGTKTILNELLAYLQLANLPAGALSEHSRLIMTYALCGFANFGSLGIMLGGLNAMVPERRQEIVSLGLRSIVSGTLATCMTGAVIGLLG
jgi:concentrative nucleoside transporter, CNT family